jgi:hypothetical protein
LAAGLVLVRIIVRLLPLKVTDFVQRPGRSVSHTPMVVA